MKDFVGFLFVVWWIFGIVLAKGFWLTLTAILFPLYAWYLVAERVVNLLQ